MNHAYAEIEGVGEVEIEYRYIPGRKGYTLGPPEKCREDEPNDVEILSAKDPETDRVLTGGEIELHYGTLHEAALRRSREDW